MQARSETKVRDSSGGRGLARTRHILVSAQVCLSLALVVGAALFTRSLDALATVDVGFSRDHLVAMDFDLEPSQLPRSELSRTCARSADARVAAAGDRQRGDVQPRAHRSIDPQH